MTTLEPGASVVFTQGRLCRPRSTAFLASSAAPIITDGLDVLVHEVMAAMTTAPWSISVSVPSSSLTFVGLDARPRVGPGATASGTTVPLTSTATGSLAGKVSAMPSSTAFRMPSESA